MASELIPVLEKIPLFADLSSYDLVAVSQRVTLRVVHAGDTLIREGTDGDEFYALVSGTAEVRHGQDVLATLGPGDHFGELALLDPAPRAAAVVVTGAGQVAVLGRGELELLLNSVPELARAMLTGLARAVRVQSDRVHW